MLTSLIWELGILVEWNIGAGLGFGVGVFVPCPINGNRICDCNSGELNGGWLFDISGELNDGWFLDTSGESNAGMLDGKSMALSIYS